MTDHIREQKRQRLVDEQFEIIHRNQDRLFATLMLIQWAAAILAAVLISPLTWDGTESRVHLHVWTAVFTGTLITLFPAMMGFCYPGKAYTRHTMAIGQMIMSGLLIHICGGRIETHFHVFGSLAFLAGYRDWKVLMTATVVVSLDHIVRGFVYPESVFGVSSLQFFRILEHAAWVLFEVAFLSFAIRNSVLEMRKIALTQLELEEKNFSIEQIVIERTRELTDERDRAHDLRKAAVAADKAKSDFLANMSHEIRTPMAAIMGYTEMLRTGELEDDDEVKMAHESIDRNSQNLMQIINDILDLSRVETGKIQVQISDVDIPDLIDEVILSLMAKAAEQENQLYVKLEETVPHVISSDANRLRQALLNLMGNAIKFTQQGKIDLFVEYEASTQRLRFHVMDTGIGISEVDCDHIFEPFHQADETSTREFGGVGLGLSVVRQIADAFQGTVKVQSTPGIGSHFTLTIPAQLVDQTEQPDEELLEPDACEVMESTSIPKIILVAEDSEDYQRLITFYLQKQDYEVICVGDGEQACETVLEKSKTGQNFNAILMDMNMPVMNGCQATKRLRSLDYNGPIIALTAQQDATQRDRCYEAGCDSFVAKPIDSKELLSEIERLTETLEPI